MCFISDSCVLTIDGHDGSFLWRGGNNSFYIGWLCLVVGIFC